MKFNSFNQLLFSPEPEPGGGGGSPAPGATPPAPGGGTPGSPNAPPAILGEGFALVDGWQDHIGEHAKGLTFKNLGDWAKSTQEAGATISRLNSELDLAKRAPGTPANIPGDSAGYITALGLDPKALPEGVEIPQTILDRVAKFGVDNKIDPAVTKQFIDFQVAMAAEEHQQYKTADFARVESSKAEIKRIVGDSNYDVTVANAEAASQALGLTFSKEDLLGSPTMVVALSKLHQKISPGTLKELNLTPEGRSAESSLQQARDILNNPQNPMNRAFYDNSDPQHQNAVDTYNRLIAETGPGSFPL